MLPDQLLDAVTFVAITEPEPGFRCRVTAPAEARLVADLLSLQGWSFVRYFAQCAAAGQGADHDGAGWLYDTDEELDREPFTGAVVFMPWDEELNVARVAFERALTRWLRAVQEGARAQGDAAVSEPWWPELEEATVQVERRAEGSA